jgi:hypothetical protein
MEDKPILLVDIDQSGKCTLNVEGLEVLRKIDSQICVTSVAGMYRTGKSYLLNRLMGRQHGFDIGPTVNPCTKGIWLWGLPLAANNKQIIVIDTEGLGSFDRDQTIDMIIFSLSVLMSSTFIYNSLGAIDEQAIEDLSLVCKLTQHIHVKSQQNSTSPEQYAQYFPKFIWALRDFSLKLVDKNGENMSSDEYLNLCIQPVEENSEENKQKNEVRKILREFFRDRECFTFVRPVNQEKKLRNIQEVPFEELRPEFREQVNRFTERVLSTARVKMIDGVGVSGKMLASLLEIYVDAINRDAVPTISTAWERTIDAQVKEAYRKACNIYKTEVKQIKNAMPMDESQLKTSEHNVRSLGMKIINQVPIISSLKDAIDKIKAKYIEKCDETFESLSIDNLHLSKSKVSKIVKDLFQALEDKVLTSDKFHWVPEDFSKIYDVIITQLVANDGLGPGTFPALSENYAKEGSRILMKILGQLNKAHKAEISVLQKEIDTERDRVAESYKSFEEVKKQLNEKLETERRHFKEQRKLLEHSLEDAKIALSGNSEEFANMQKKLRQENLELSRQLVEISKELIQQLSQQSTILKEEKQFSDLKLEYEMKMTSILYSDVERNAQRQMLEAKKMSDQIVAQLKKSYEREIKELKTEANLYEIKLRDFAQEVLKRDMQIKVLNQKFRGREEERRLRVEQSDLIISVGDLIIKFLRKLETGKGGDLKEELDELQGN